MGPTIGLSIPSKSNSEFSRGVCIRRRWQFLPPTPWKPRKPLQEQHGPVPTKVDPWTVARRAGAVQLIGLGV
jgi:hypothetical protein